ncbi:MAG: hypothetical protein WCD18_09870 [Thermosynechococcaceae cyanobacterium]
MAAYLYPAYTLISLFLTIWGMVIFATKPDLSAVLMILVLLGITYDSLIISLGSLINEGDLLKCLNQLRYLFHSLFVPLLVVVTREFAEDAGVLWVTHWWLDYSIWVLTFGLITIGVVSNILNPQLTPTQFGGTLSYKLENASPAPAILTTLLVAIAGVYIWLQTGWSWMLSGTLLVICGNAVPTCRVGTLVSSASEMGFMLTLLATELVV